MFIFNCNSYKMRTFLLSGNNSIYSVRNLKIQLGHVLVRLSYRELVLFSMKGVHLLKNCFPSSITQQALLLQHKFIILGKSDYVWTSKVSSFLVIIITIPKKLWDLLWCPIDTNGIVYPKIAKLLNNSLALFLVVFVTLFKFH